MSPQTLHDLIFESNQLGIKLREFLASCDIINQNDDLGDVEERHLDVMKGYAKRIRRQSSRAYS